MTDGIPGDDMTPAPLAPVEVMLRTDIEPDAACINCGQPKPSVGCSACPHCGASMCE